MVNKIMVLVVLLCMCACSTVHIKYGEVEITAWRLFEDQNLEGLTVITPEGVTVSIDKKSNNANTQLLSDSLGAIVDAVITIPGE